MTPALRVGLVALAFCASATSCSTEPSPSSQPPSEDLAYLLAAARAYPATEEQLAILEAAQSGEEITYSDVRDLFDQTYGCFDQHGVPYWPVEDREIAPGFLMPAYNFAAIPGLSDEASLAIVDDCELRYSHFVDMAYQMQPVVFEAQQAQIRERLPLVIECLREQGVEIDDDATLDEAEQASYQKSQELTAAGIDNIPCYFLILP